MKKLLVSMLLSPLLFGLTLIPGYLYGNEPYVDMSNCKEITERYKDEAIKPPCGSFPKEPAWWSNGLPLPIYVFGDCPSGCITEFKSILLIIDLLFWLVISYLMYFVFSKSISFFKK